MVELWVGLIVSPKSKNDILVDMEYRDKEELYIIGAESLVCFCKCL